MTVDITDRNVWVVRTLPHHRVTWVFDRDSDDLSFKYMISRSGPPRYREIVREAGEVGVPDDVLDELRSEMGEGIVVDHV